MKKIYLFAFIVISGFLQSQNAQSQCTPATPWVGSVPWTETATFPNAYAGFLCQGHDSIYTRPTWAFWDGDGYSCKLIAGEQITITVDSCLTTGNSSITICDSTVTLVPNSGNILAGLYVAAACPNSLSFTAPYTGTYYIVFDSDMDCTTAGTVPMGTCAIKLNNAASFTNCNPIPTPVNDTICGAIALTLATPVSGNTVYADPLDPRDADVTASGYACSFPNNTLWYSFTPANNGNYDFNTTSPIGGLDMWVGLFSASSCTSTLTYMDCQIGAAPGGTYTTTAYLTGSQLYYLMIDGYNGATGAYTIELVSNTTGINENTLLASQVTVYPNPAKGLLNISNNLKSKETAFTIFNSIGQDVYSSELNGNMNTQVDVSNFADGIYSIQFKSNEGVFTKKIAIQNQN